MNDINFTLENLLRSRYQGASNITGIRFQLLYSVLRAFDLYADAPAHEVQFEGLEDVDVRGTQEKALRGLSIGDTYVQVKHTGTPKTLSWLDHEKIFDHFIEVYLEYSDARFVVVTSLPIKSKSNLEDLMRYCHGQRANLPPYADQVVHAIAARAGLAVAELPAFLRRVSFQSMSEGVLLERLHIALIRSFDLTAGNELLYLSQLVNCATSWAANRAVLQKQHLERERIRVQEWISLGVENPAVRDRLIQQLDMVAEEMVEDYYEGKQARLGHILAALDAPRPGWQRAIEEAFKRVHVSIIRASSGQGKSTLLYRYAADHFACDTIYRLQSCSREEHVGFLVDYLQNRLLLGLPLLVLVDNLGYQTRLWYQVAAALAGKAVYFLLTSREEDWFRYSFGASSFAREYIEPYLSLQEARTIFNNFSQRGKVAPNVPSAGWAYEQVAEKRLLIEFVYLITHGQMLAERIEEQVATIEAQGEDRAKLEVLRLVATAQMYGARMSIKSLLQHVDFQQDPDRTLKALEREYIICIDGMCEGLHFVRSEHLVQALHAILPVQHTVLRLLKILDVQNLVALVASAFADTGLEGNDLLPALVERCRSVPLSVVNKIIEALFLADETSYVQAHKQVFDAAAEQLGTWSLPLLTALTLPSGEVKSLQSLVQEYSDRPAMQVLSRLAQQIRPREETGQQRIPRAFLEELLKSFPMYGQESLADIGQICTWCHFFNASAPALNEFLLEAQWEARLLQSDSESIAQFLLALHQFLPDRYSQFAATYRSALFRRFKLESRTLGIEEQDNGIRITFIVDVREGAESPNDQAVWRLKLLRRWFPFYERYRSQGLYPSVVSQKPKVDDSHKDMTGDTLDLLSLHAPKNRLYSQMVEESYSPLLVYDWEKPWDALRRVALRFARNIISQYESAYRGRPVDIRQIAAQARELDTLQGKVLPLPKRLKDAFVSEQHVMTEWSSFLLNFVRQYVQHDPQNSQQQNSRLMRSNLKDVIKRLPTFHRAFSALFRVEPDHFSMTMLNKQEGEAYTYLSELLDYWFEGHNPPVRQLESAINEWREEQCQAFARSVRKSLAPLAEQEMQFLYPTGPAYDHPLKGLYLGYEVMDFTQQIEQVLLIIKALASLKVEYYFLYLIPTVHKQVVAIKATRFTEQTIKQLAAGEADAEVYPVPLPENIQAVLPDLNINPPADVMLALELGELLALSLAERNKRNLAHLMLNMQIEEEAQLFRYYDDEVSVRLQQLVVSWNQLQEKAYIEDNGAAQQQWQHLWQEAATMVKQLAELDNHSTDELQQLSADWSALNAMIAKYMNRKYLGLEDQQNDTVTIQ
jgi:hypothetical protein